MRVNTLLNTVVTLDDDAIGIRMKKLIIQKNAPDGVHELAMAMGQEMFFLGLPLWMP
jgi:hypothetical protein